MPFGQGINRFRFFYGCIHIPGITETVCFYQNAIKSHNISHRLYLIMLYKVKCGSLYKQSKFREYISPFFAPPPLRFAPAEKQKSSPSKREDFFRLQVHGTLGRIKKERTCVRSVIDNLIIHLGERTSPKGYRNASVLIKHKCKVSSRNSFIFH